MQKQMAAAYLTDNSCNLHINQNSVLASSFVLRFVCSPLHMLTSVPNQQIGADH